MVICTIFFLSLSVVLAFSCILVQYTKHTHIQYSIQTAYKQRTAATRTTTTAAAAAAALARKQQQTITTPGI